MCVQDAIFNEKTQLEFAVLLALGCKNREELQRVTQAELDTMTPKIMEGLESEDVLDHMIRVYDRTADQYASNPSYRFIIPKLVEFISMLGDGDLVLDMGCGPGLDALVMASSDQVYRASVVRGNVDPSTMPEQALRVKAIDASARMIEIAEKIAKGAEARGTGRLRYPPIFKHADMHEMGAWAKIQEGWFAGVWSCASFLTHTPRQWVDPILAQIAGLLRPDGIFAVSYTQRQKGGGYDKLKLSSTGEIKYFSHPDPAEVLDLAARYGLLPIRHMRKSDYVGANGEVVPDLFVTQFFRKEI